MVGNYMDAPSDRVAYDRDGSIGAALLSDGSISTLTTTSMRVLNSETGDGYTAPNTSSYLAITFPIPMDIAAVFVAAVITTTEYMFQTSKDTTNGLDGTWTDQVYGTVPNSVAPQYRQLNQLKMTVPGASSTGVRGVRMTRRVNPVGGVSNLKILAFHVYATPSTTATDDRLAFWHPTLDEKVAPTYFDWGDVPRGSTEDRSFRIKNLSNNQRALDIALFIESLTPASPPTQGMFMLSNNAGATFLTSLTLPLLDPGQTSGVLICRRTVPTNASVSVWTVRIVADVTTWQEV